MPISVPGPEDTAMNKTDVVPAYPQVHRADNQAVVIQTEYSYKGEAQGAAGNKSPNPGLEGSGRLPVGSDI